jgi:hypothetical protein
MKKNTILRLMMLLCTWTASSSIFAQSSAEDRRIDATSSGVAMTGTTGEQELLSWNGAITNRSANRRTSTICQFMSGPKAHGWHDFAPFPPAPIDSTCEDGAGSVGFVQPVGHGDRY